MNKKSTRALASATVVGLVLTTAISTGNVQAAPGKVDRLDGANRYETAAKVATSNWKAGETKNVILVSGQGYADALSASLLAQKLDAPVLLTGKDSLDANTKNAINKLGAKNVYILGSKGVISENIKSSLENEGKTVKRLAGKDRYETNIAIANELVSNHGVSAKEVLVVNGNKYLADALTAAPVAAKEGKILLLVGEDESTANEAKKFIDAHSSKVTVIGRDVTVSDVIYNKLGASKRVKGGADRFETNRLVLDAFNMKGSHLYIANGQNDHLVDSLVASALAGKFNSPVVLVSNDKDTDAKAVKYMKENLKINDKTDLNVVGSEAILSDDLVKDIDSVVTPQSEDVVAAEKAVKAYESAKLTNAEEIKAAKELKAEAVKTVKVVKDEAKKADFEKRIAEADKKLAEAEAKFAIAADSVKSLNETAIQVSGLAKDVNEKALEGKKITLKANDVELTATYVKGSLTEDGKANFVLENGKKLTDTVKYTVSADWAKLTIDTFTARVKTPYIAKVEVSTKILPANLEKKDKDLNLVRFTAKNQYGEDLTLSKENVKGLEVKGTINGAPLKVEEINKDNIEKGIIQINVDLKEGDKISLALTKKINEKDVEVGNASYVVVKGAAQVATDLSDIKATYKVAENGHEKDKKAEEVLPDDQIDLKLEVNDQFGNPMKNDTDVRWVVEEGKDLINVTTPDYKDGVVDSVDFAYTAKNAGKVKITAYNVGNGKSKSYTVEIGAKKLTELKLADEAGTRFNKDENIVKVVTPNDGANLKASDIKFDVKTEEKGLTSADVEVSAKVRGGEDKDKKNDIVIAVKSKKAGKYTITPYVGESLEKSTAHGDAFDVTTTVDQTVTSIDDIKFDAAELKIGTEIKKDVTFRNKHGEVVVVENKKADVTVTPNIDIKDGANVATVTKEEKDGVAKNILTLKLKDAKNYNVVVNKGDVFKAYNLKFVGAKFTAINAGADITGVVAGDAEVNKAKYQEVKFLDQDGKAMDVKKEDIKVSVTKPDGQELDEKDLNKLITLGKTYSVDKKGVVNFEESDDSKDNIVAYKISPVATLTQGTYTVKIADKDNKISDTVTVTVGAKRVAKAVEVTATSASIALNGKTELKIVPKDQYGELIEVGAGKIEIKAGDNFKIGAVSELEDDKAVKVGYKAEVSGIAKGSGEVVVNVKDGDKVLATNKVKMTVDSVAGLINSVEIDKEGIQPAYSTKEAGTKVQLKAIAKDAKGQVVPVDASKDLAWKIKSVKGKVAAEDPKNVKDATVATVGTIAEHTGEFTPAQNFNGTVTIEVLTANMKSAEITLTCDSKEAAPQKGTTNVVASEDKKVLDGNKDKSGIQVLLDGKDADGEKDGAVVVKVVAKDQFGKDFKETKITNANAKVMVDDRSVVDAKIDDATNSITLTSKAKGTANVNVIYNGDTVKLEVSVNEEAAKAAKTKAEADNLAKATQEAKEALNGAITKAKQGKDAVKEGTAADQVEEGTDFVLKADKEDYNKAITTAEGIKDNGKSTKKEFEDALKELNKATETFNGKKQKGTKKAQDTDATLKTFTIGGQSVVDLENVTTSGAEKTFSDFSSDAVKGINVEANSKKVKKVVVKVGKDEVKGKDLAEKVLSEKDVITVEVTAESGATKTYKVTVKKTV
ncbi:cell wall-binding repeat-containing protein [Clostridium niameyense]|uniref:cell wall-binding repeat-containing protein n=1 Tax=Clostridium niameyense TaxID=1622073 RepID=UPI00067F6118|nr:cell wall-binding repeat-containing protein [Clostridium niameyense]